MQSRTVSLFHLFELIIAFIAVVFVFFNEQGCFNAYLALLVIGINVYTVFKVKDDWYLFFIFAIITYSNYSICVANYLTDSINNYFVGYANTETAVKGLHILLFFSILLMLLAPYTKHEDTVIQRSILVNNRENKLIVFGIILVLVLIWVYGFTRPSVAGERGAPSAIYEYSIILFIVSLYYSGKNRALIITNILIAVAFALQNFAYGGRITGVQLIFLIVLGVFIDKLSFKRVIPFGILFFVMMSAIGIYRANFSLSNIDFKVIAERLFSGYFTMDTSYSAYFTSMTFLEELTYTSYSKRFALFFRWVLSVFLGGRVADSNLAIYTRQHYVHYYGGILPFYAWFYLGVLGVIALAFYLIKLFSVILKSNSNSNGLARCVAIYIASTTMRWYIYSPSQLFRGLLFLCLVYGLAYLIDKVSTQKVI